MNTSAGSALVDVERDIEHAAAAQLQAIAVRPGADGSCVTVVVSGRVARRSARGARGRPP